MKAKLFVVLFAVILITGCHTPSTRMNYISVGMTEPEVIKFLGQPASHGVNKDGSSVLNYTLNEGTINDDPVPYSVHFTNGKVDYYGRDEGGSGSKPPTVITTIPMVR